MNILITGGAGYIGSHVVKALLETTDYKITIIDNLSTGDYSTITTLEQIAQEFDRTFYFHKADLSDFSAIEKIFISNHFDAIIHFAASIVVSESVENPLKYYLNNTVNTTHLIQCAEKYGIKQFIFSSTAAVYGEPDTPSVSETTPTKPINPYGMSKLMSETVLGDTAAAHPELKFVILRYFNVAGASIDNKIGQSFPNATHLIKIAAECAAKKREKMYIFGKNYPTSDGTCIRDYIHIEDLASSHLASLEYLKNGGKSDIFNCGYGRGYSVTEVINTMKKVSNIDFSVEEGLPREGDPSQLIANNKKILDTLPWIPKYNDLSLICRTGLAWEQKMIQTQ